VTEKFPCIADYRGLIVDDFIRFSKSYAEILKECLPTAQNIYFSNSDGQFLHNSTQKSSAEWRDVVEEICRRGKGFAIHSQCLLLPFSIKDGKSIAAVVEGADPIFLDKVREDWLEETRLAAERRFILLKEARIDIHTGLLNLWNLYSLLDSSSGIRQLHLILIELPPKRSSFRYAVRYSQKCATLIQSFVQGNSVLHAIGSSTFALVLPADREGATKALLESALVTYLKREGCHRVHVGSSVLLADEGASGVEGMDRNLLNEAWTALHQAEKRGPFSFCVHNPLGYPENNPLLFSKGLLVRRLRRLWRISSSFSLVQFRSLGADHAAKDIVPDVLDRGVSFFADNDVFVFLDGCPASEAFSWSQAMISMLAGIYPKNLLAAGVAYYPCSNFKKSEIPNNCGKALLHAAFFGDSRAIVFDAISQNISGDMYFGDGDLTKAVQEYRRGLLLDDNNVNLHNSLGVALAMMDKIVPAMQSFERALAISPNNFMTLYNLGLAEQARGGKTAAFRFFQLAFSHYNKDDADRSLFDDLSLQLGILAGDLEKHQEALQYLETWWENHKNSPRAGRVLYHLGKARYGVGDSRQAMVDLQRALQFNEFDDRAMNLLGILYLQENEGNEIALALCRKSVELEPNNTLYRCNLAEVQMQCGMPLAAREHLYRCLKNNHTRQKAQLLLGRSYAQEGQKRRAITWFEKILKQRSVSTVLSREITLEIQKVGGR